MTNHDIHYIDNETFLFKSENRYFIENVEIFELGNLLYGSSPLALPNTLCQVSTLNQIILIFRTL